ncbi:MAG: hypothetical protein ACI9JM_000419 [Halioglobus sp.]
MKSKTLMWLAGVNAALFGGLYLFGSTTMEPLHTITTRTVLPATVEESWEVLTDFSQYPDWNPYLPRVDGVLAPGEKVSFTLASKNFPESIDMTATLGEVTDNVRFFWKGRLVIQGLFDTRHVFELQQREDGDTDLHHFEEFRGVIPALLPWTGERAENTQMAFESMNEALRLRLGQEHRIDEATDHPINPAAHP